jgi:hypothetical protein
MLKNKNHVSIASLVLGIGIYLAASFIGSQEVKEPKDKSEEENILETLTAIIKPEEDVENKFPLDMTEDEVQKAIHHMSHAKVYAKEKWSHLEPNQARIDRLLYVVERNENFLDYGNLYIRILERWQSGNFSNAVTDHNSIWDLQGGTIGEATRLLTEEEQAAYKVVHF